MDSVEYLTCQGFVAQVVRTKRVKSARLQVHDGAVFIFVPKDLEQGRVRQLLEEKRSWIKAKLALHQQQKAIPKRELLSGEAFPYLGRNYRLKIQSGTLQPVKLLHGRLHVVVPDELRQEHFFREMLTYWYRTQAAIRFQEKVKRYAPVVGVKPEGVSVKTFKSRWGSCTTKGELQFHWKVIMAPHRIVDYVVVHELCHLLHHDHSPAFWKSVERIVPDYLECKTWLKEFGAGFEV